MTQRSTTVLVLSCAAFAIAGAACRLVFVHVESRVQIAAFCAAAVLFQFASPEWLRRSAEDRAKFAFVWNAAAATFAIVATRIAIEGIPYKVLTVLDAIRA